MIRALMMDWGGVLMRTVDIRPRRDWERRLGLPVGGLTDAFFGSPEWDQAMRGEIGIDDVWAAANRELGLDASTLEKLSRAFWAGDRLDEELVALLRQVRRDGVRVALLSNHVPWLAELLAELDVADVFDVRVISALEGVTKPDPAIFELTLERIGAAPTEAAFVDDWSVSVQAARALGVHGIRFRGVTHLRRALAAAGLPVETPQLEPVPGVRAVIFDWGGVISPLAFRAHTREWEERLGLAAGTIDAVLWGSMWKQLEVGAISSAEFDAHVARGLGLLDRDAVRGFYDQFYANDTVEKRVLDTARALRSRYRVAMLTNAFPGHAEHVQERYGFDPRAEFDVYVNSAEVGLAKPDPAIYALALEQLGVAPDEAVLVDDMVRNVDGAQNIGMHGIVFADVETGLADLAALLGEPDLAK